MKMIAHQINHSTQYDNTINKYVNKSCSNAVIRYFYWPHWSLQTRIPTYERRLMELPVINTSLAGLH